MSEAMNELTGMMAKTPKTALDLALVAFGKAIVTLEPNGCPPAPSEAELAMYAARKRLKAIDADSPKKIAALEVRLKQADAAWQAAESQRVRICQMLGVDYTCEEPETCEQVIERLQQVYGAAVMRLQELGEDAVPLHAPTPLKTLSGLNSCQSGLCVHRLSCVLNVSWRTALSGDSFKPRLQMEVRGNATLVRRCVDYEMEET